MSSELTTHAATGALATTNNVVAVPQETLERFPAVDPESEILDLLAENLNEGETLGIGNLTRVVNPSGKSVSFQIPSADGGKDQTVESLEGIVLGWQEGRTFYASSDATDGTPPDCSSRDGITGFGEFGINAHSDANPSGLCADCPMGQWVRVEGKEDVPPPCKPMVNVLLLTELEALPLLLRVPRTSMTAFNKYRKGLIRYNTGLARSVAKISLVSATNPQGTRYAEFVFGLAEKLPGSRDEAKATAAAVMHFGEQMKGIITAPPARQAVAITARPSDIDGDVVEGGGASFAEPVDYDDNGQPSDDELAELAERDAETSNAAAS